MRVIASSVLGAVALVLATASVGLAASTTNSADNLRDGWYPNAGISPEVVQGGTFGQLWSATVNGQVYAQPLVDDGPGGTDSVIAATETNHVYALDPANGTERWADDLGTPWNPGDIGCGDIQPAIGDTSTPVIDPSTDTIYLTHKTYASGSSGPAVWYMDALDGETGEERPGFPVALNGTADNAPGVSFAPTTQQQRPGLLLLDGVVYAGFGSHCDTAPWKGWVFGVNAASGAITARWVDIDSAGTSGGGIWQAGTGLMSDGPNTIVLTTGNGGAPQTPAPGNTPETSYGDSVVRLDVQPNGTLAPVDFFAPFDAIQLDDTDADFASGGIVGLPDQYFGTSSVPHLAVVDGKEGYVYLLNRDDLGGYKQGVGGGDAVVQRLGPFAGVWGRPGVWPGDGGYVYIAPSGSDLDVYKYGTTSAGTPTLSSDGSTSDTFGWGSGSPVITSDGATSGSATVWVIWAADRSGSGGQLRAYDPVPSNGTLQMIGEWSIGNATNYSTPGVGDDGHLYVGTRDGRILAFGSPVSQPVSAPALGFPTTVDGSTSQATLRIQANEPVSITGISSSSPDFSVGSPSLPASLGQGQTLSVPVTFAPGTDVGTIGGQITIQTDSGPVAVPVSGTGSSATALLQAGQPRLALGGVAVGQQLSGTVTFTNEGSQALTITGEHLPQAPFSAPDAPALNTTIAAGQTVTVTVDFDPTAAGTFSDDIELDGTGGTSAAIDVSATAAQPGELQFSGDSVDFGQVPVGGSATQSFTITNAGGTTVTIERSKPPFGGAFSATTALQEGSTIDPGQTVTETVRFSPTAPGPQSATWSINGDDTTGRHDITFTGTGLAAGQAATTPTGTAPTPTPHGHQITTVPRPPRLSRTRVTQPWAGRVRLSYTAVAAGAASFVVLRRVTGRRLAHSCVVVTRRVARHRRCTRLVVIGRRTRHALPGPASLRLSQIVATRRLRPGAYVIDSVLRDTNGRAHAFQTALTVRPAPRRGGHDRPARGSGRSGASTASAAVRGFERWVASLLDGVTVTGQPAPAGW